MLGWVVTRMAACPKMSGISMFIQKETSEGFRFLKKGIENEEKKGKNHNTDISKKKIPISILYQWAGE